MAYTFGKAVNIAPSQAVERVTEALAKEGFGILSDIDVAQGQCEIVTQ